MATTKLYLDKRTIVNGVSPIKLVVTHEQHAVYISLGISVAANQWDKKLGKVINHPQKQLYNNILMQRKLDADNTIMRYAENNSVRGLTASDFKRIILAKDDETPDTSNLFMARYVAFANTKRERTKEMYLATAKKIRAFSDRADSLTFENITKDWLQRFDNWMSATCGTNSRNIHMRNVRAVFNDALDNELITCYPFRRFKIKKEATRKRSLTVEQLRELFNYPVEDYAVRYLDMFKLIFFLCGINIIDLCHLKEITNGRVEYRRAKTHRLYSVKVEPEAMDIINKYKGEKYLLNMLDTASFLAYCQHINVNLQRIGEVTWKGSGRNKHKERKPLFPDITTYWARHSWATIAASLDIPKDVIAAGLGHGGNTVTDIYIDFDQSKVDAANRKIIDWVLYGKK